MNKKLKVRFITNFPLSIVFGGFEHQCIQTCKALKSIGVDAGLLDWHDATDNNYILHLFGASIMWERIVEYWANRGPIVISAIAGTRGFKYGPYVIKKSVSRIVNIMHQKTTYTLTRKLLHKSDKIICLNQLEQDYFVRNYNLPFDKTVVVSNGVDETRYCTDRNLFIEKFGISDFVLYVGNITHRKNPLVLGECLNQLGLQGVFIGKAMSSEVRYVNKFKNLINNSSNLLWIPGLDYKDSILNSSFAAARVLCLPSMLETQPLTALEAMAAGTPVILGDFPYAYQSPFENSIKVNPSNKEKLKVAIKNAMSQVPSNVARLSDEYCWNKVAEKIIQVYSEIYRR